MAVKIPTPEIARTGSHSITIGHDGEREREEVFVYCATEWRGAPVIVTMRADRYRHSSGLSEWRVYASEARSKTNEPYGFGAHVTDTARQRLNDACKPLALTWLDSDDYRTSEADALHSAAASAVTYGSHGRGWRYDGTALARQILSTYGDKMTAAQVDHIERLTDAADTLAAIADERP